MEAEVPGYVKAMAQGAMGKVMPADAGRGIPRSDVQLGGMGRNFRMSPSDVPTTPDVPTDVPTCECGKPREGRYKLCSACRKRAYRERSRG